MKNYSIKLKPGAIIAILAFALLLVSFMWVVAPELRRSLVMFTLLTALWGYGALQSAMTGGDVDTSKDKGGEFWLQRADSSVETITDETHDGIMKAFKNFDWAAELKSQKQLGRKNSVPPGLGLGNYGDDIFVHITMPELDRTEALMFHRAKPGKKKDAFEEVYKEDLPVKKVGDVVKAFLDRDVERLLKLLR